MPAGSRYGRNKIVDGNLLHVGRLRPEEMQSEQGRGGGACGMPVLGVPGTVPGTFQDPKIVLRTQMPILDLFQEPTYVPGNIPEN